MHDPDISLAAPVGLAQASAAARKRKPSLGLTALLAVAIGLVVSQGVMVLMLQGAGIAGLTLLQAQELAACTVSHTSACIGQATSTLADGVLSHANDAARALGLQTGLALAPQVQALARRHACSKPHNAVDSS